jgi:hypothetical protein
MRVQWSVMCLLAFAAAWAQEAEMVVRARYLGATTDSSYKCGFVRAGTVTRYDSVEALSGGPADSVLYVVHPCMELPRQRVSANAGNLFTFRPLDRHFLFLTSKSNVQMVGGKAAGRLFYCLRVDSAPRDIVRLPQEVRRSLDIFFPGWRLLPVRPDVYAQCGREQPGGSPVVAGGDFDGDSATDYAVQVLIQYANNRAGMIVAALKRPDRYAIVKADTACDYLVVRRKGAQVEAGGVKVELEQDAIEARSLGQAQGVRYRFEKGAFKRVGDGSAATPEGGAP